MRRLIHVPIIHDEFNEGGLLNISTEETNLILYEKKRIQSELNNYWDKIDNYLKDEKISKIYQDGYVSRESLEQRKINPLTLKSRNIKTLNNLINSGSDLMNTESEEILRKFSREFQESKSEINNTLERDEYIIKNIDRTLKIRETAVLFIGFGHSPNIDKILSKYKTIYTEKLEYNFPLEYITRLYSDIQGKLHQYKRNKLLKI